MGILSYFAKKSSGLAPKKRKGVVNQKRYQGAVLDRLTSDFKGSYLSINTSLEKSLPRLQARSRQLAEDNDYARKFLSMVKANVVGSTGFVLQSKAKKADGTPDKLDIKTIETAWRKWGLRENCSMSGNVSFRDLQRLLIETVARDGEALVRMVKGHGAFGFGLHVMECDHLDINHNRILKNGHQIRMGIELDGWGKPQAYHLLTQHPGDQVYMHAGQKYLRIPAQEILHCFVTERPGQARGIPHMSTAIKRLHQIGAFQEAALVNARLGASKMGFYTSENGDGYDGDEDEDGALIYEAQPGQFEQLPSGVKLETFDTAFPSSETGPFVKDMLRGAASGLTVSYNSLSNDLENVNFSSIRSGVLEEREHWRVLQDWMIQAFCRPVFNNWLKMAITTGALPLPMTRLEKFEEVVWQARGWAWVDPLRDIKAGAEAIATGVQTRTDLAAAQGKDVEEIFEQLKKEEDLAKTYGITISSLQDANNAHQDSFSE